MHPPKSESSAGNANDNDNASNNDSDDCIDRQTLVTAPPVPSSCLILGPLLRVGIDMIALELKVSWRLSSFCYPHTERKEFQKAFRLSLFDMKQAFGSVYSSQLDY
jgi:hypothetical protein